MDRVEWCDKRIAERKAIIAHHEDFIKRLEERKKIEQSKKDK